MMTQAWQKVGRRPGRFKRSLYKRGYRPKPGSVFYSPSLDLLYAWRDNPLL